MKFDYNKIELNRDDLNMLHDVFMEALNKYPISDEEIIGYWKELPDHIKADAVKWGVSDTPTRDAMYVWLQEKYNI